MSDEDADVAEILAMLTESEVSQEENLSEELKCERNSTNMVLDVDMKEAARSLLSPESEHDDEEIGPSTPSSNLPRKFNSDAAALTTVAGVQGLLFTAPYDQDKDTEVGSTVVSLPPVNNTAAALLPEKLQKPCDMGEAFSLSRSDNGCGRQALQVFDLPHSSAAPPLAMRRHTKGALFPKVFHELLTESEYPSIMEWGDDGKSFIIHDLEQFKTTILPRSFHHCNLDSFRKQLQRYDFLFKTYSNRHDPSKIMIGAHLHFVRERPDLLVLMRARNGQQHKGV